MNPYAKYLDGRGAVDILTATPSALQSLTAGPSPEQMEARPAPGKWSVCEILAHLADCEIVWAFRMRQAMETPGVTISAFDQDVWATRYSAYSWRAALQTFLAVRAWNLALMPTVSEEELTNLLHHPERGTFPFSELLEIMAGHDLNHLERLKEQLETAGRSVSRHA